MNAETIERIVEIPVLIGSNFYTTKHVILNWQCPVCGGTRGDVYRTQAYDGSLRVNCDGWQNPCGHIDMYEAVLKEAQALQDGKAQSLEPIFDVMLNPDAPAHTDAFLSGDTVKSILNQDTMSAKKWRALAEQMKAHELHEADGSGLDELQDALNANAALQARIAQLEAFLRSAEKGIRDRNTVITQMGGRTTELEALLAEAKQVIAPIAESVAIDTDLMKAKDGAGLFIRNSDGDRFVPIETNNDELHVRQLRAIATFVSKLDTALK